MLWLSCECFSILCNAFLLIKSAISIHNSCEYSLVFNQSVNRLRLKITFILLNVTDPSIIRMIFTFLSCCEKAHDNKEFQNLVCNQNQKSKQINFTA